MNKFAVRRAIAALALAEETIVALTSEPGITHPLGIGEIVDELRLQRESLVKAATEAGLLADEAHADG